jgi:hypothetical protein
MSKSWKLLWFVSAVCLACAVSVSVADDEIGGGQDKGKGKGKGKNKSEIVQVDLAKMPKDLANQVRDYIIPAASEGDKGQKGQKGDEDSSKGKGKSKGKSDEKAKPKSDEKPQTPDAAKLEKRIDKIVQQLEDLRLEIQGKKKPRKDD